MRLNTRLKDAIIFSIIGFLLTLPLSVQWVYSWEGTNSTISPGYIEGFVLRPEVIKLIPESPIINDVAVTEVKPERTIMPNNTAASINVTVENQGNVDVTFNVTLYCNFTQIGIQKVILGVNQSAVLTFQWTTPAFPGNYTLRAEAGQVSGEINLANNVFVFGDITVQTFWPTDLNYDGIVNIVDISIVAVAFGSTPEDLGWNIIADLNNDEIINILDVSMVAMEFGKTV